jgi:hypothetical protein
MIMDEQFDEKFYEKTNLLRDQIMVLMETMAVPKLNLLLEVASLVTPIIQMILPLRC